MFHFTDTKEVILALYVVLTLRLDNTITCTYTKCSWASCNTPQTLNASLHAAYTCKRRCHKVTGRCQINIWLHLYPTNAYQLMKTRLRAEILHLGCFNRFFTKSTTYCSSDYVSLDISNSLVLLPQVNPANYSCTEGEKK